MWVPIRNLLVSVLFTEPTLKAIALGAGLGGNKAEPIAKAIMSVKLYIDTKDKKYINSAIDELQKLI